MTKVIAIVSGGMDSTVLLHWLKKTMKQEVVALTIDYGQRHRKEILCAREQARAVSVPHEVIDASAVFRAIGGSCLTDSMIDVPHGHYTDESMKQTVVPNRNMILLSIAIGVAIKVKASSVAYGAHSGDHAIYPDCRPRFARAMAKAAKLADWHPVKLDRPFIHHSKGEIVEMGLELGVDFSKTWSCYEGEELACGKCGTCVERLEAFFDARADDPLQYRDRAFWQQKR
jgi:7-cyano-7-deazaguanine synthase